MGTFLAVKMFCAKNEIKGDLNDANMKITPLLK